MSWSNAYIGIPWRDRGRARDGADCWGLAMLVHAAEAGNTLPGYDDYASAEERREVAALVAGASVSPLWRRVTRDPDSGAPAALDIVVFARGGIDSHIGIVVRPGLMLHMAVHDCAKVESYRDGRWRHRLTGIFRWTGGQT